MDNAMIDPGLSGSPLPFERSFYFRYIPVCEKPVVTTREKPVHGV